MSDLRPAIIDGGLTRSELAAANRALKKAGLWFRVVREPATRGLKARRLVLSGAVRCVGFSEGDGIVTEVKGDTGIHSVEIMPDGSTDCSCYAGSAKQGCSHAPAAKAALRIVNAWHGGTP